MINETQAVALMHEANPVPDLESYNVTEPDISAHLANLKTKSGEATRADSKKSNPEGPKRSIQSWLIAAALAAVVGVAVLVMNQTGQTPVVDQPTPTTLAEETKTPVVGSRYVGANTSIGLLEWTQVSHDGGCQPVMRVDEERGGYYSGWCSAGGYHSTDGYTWTPIPDFPDWDDPDNVEFHIPSAVEIGLDAESLPTLPVEATEVDPALSVQFQVIKTSFGWLVTQKDLEAETFNMWISVDGRQWEQIESPPDQIPVTSLQDYSFAGAAGDLIYIGYADRPDGYLLVGHFRPDGRPWGFAALAGLIAGTGFYLWRRRVRGKELGKWSLDEGLGTEGR